jgi:hypothetical protein
MANVPPIAPTTIRPTDVRDGEGELANIAVERNSRLGEYDRDPETDAEYVAPRREVIMDDVTLHQELGRKSVARTPWVAVNSPVPVARIRNERLSRKVSLDWTGKAMRPSEEAKSPLIPSTHAGSE